MADLNINNPIQQNPDDQIKALEDRMKEMQAQSKEINSQIINSRSQVSAAATQASRPIGTSPESMNQDKRMKSAQAAKSRADLKFYEDALKKNKGEADLIQQQMTNLQNNQQNAQNEQMAKINKQHILRMLQEAEPARMTKRDLIESISNQLLTEEMDDELRRKIDSGENDYAEHIDPETVKRMADDIMNDVRANLEAKGGRRNVNLDGAQRILAQGLTGALQKEQGHTEELEQLAVRLVSEEYNVPADAVDFEVKITGHPAMGGESIRKEGLKMRKGNRRPPQGKTEEELKPNVTKRRLMNAMMHGAARKGQNLFYMAQDELSRIDPSLTQDYGKLMAGNDFMYWGLNDETISQESQEGAHAGQVKVYPHGNPPREGNKPKIVAQGMTFPFLLHELTKGVLELISQWGREQDKGVRDYVEDKTDNLEAEPWDIRLGTKIWDKLLEALDVDALPYKTQIFTALSSLPATEFNGIMNGLLHDSEQAKRAVKNIVMDVIQEMNQEEVNNATNQFSEPEGEDSGDTATPEGEDEGEDEELNRLLGKKSGKEEPAPQEEEDPSTWSKRELENARDEALDNGDYKVVAYLQTILDKKYGY